MPVTGWAITVADQRQHRLQQLVLLRLPRQQLLQHLLLRPELGQLRILVRRRPNKAGTNRWLSHRWFS